VSGEDPMSSSFTSLATKFHKQIEQSIAPLKDLVVGPAQIRKVLVEKFPSVEKDIDWILPSDHCVNHTNKGACECAMSETALFERVGHGKYRVL
jgi:hypothetical protein